MKRATATALAAVGILLVVGALYSAFNAGRIDIIDGQYRFEVARNLVELGSLNVADEFLVGAVPGLGGRYSPYGAAGSIVGVPLIWLAGLSGPPSQDRQQFFFSFTSAVFGGLTALVLFLFLSSLHVPPASAIAWTFVASFATLMFPASATVFDQAQHACMVITACYLAYLSRTRDSFALAAAGGGCLAFLLNFQEAYVILIPTLGLPTLVGRGAPATDRRRAKYRFVVFVVVALTGLLIWGLINEVRFGSLLFSGKGVNHPPAFGNPAIGLAGLLVSPGKSIFLYSPPIIIALAGLRGLFHRDAPLAVAVVGSSWAQLLLASSLSFFGGDWCWGPRYFVPILPLMALALPFAKTSGSRRWLAAALIVAGFGVQTMALAVEPHRFFYERSLPAFFWARNPTFYFSHSALFARPAEIVKTWQGVPPEADRFRPGPYPQLLTYAVFGAWGHPELSPPEWVRKFKVFWLPRPWFAWMSSVDEDIRPVNLFSALSMMGGLGLLGAGSVAMGYRSLVRDAVR